MLCERKKLTFKMIMQLQPIVSKESNLTRVPISNEYDVHVIRVTIQ